MSDRAKVLLAGVLVAVAIVGLWFVLLWNPTKDKLEAAQAREAAAEQQGQQLQTRLATLKALERRAPQLEADRAKLLTAIPTEDKVDEFLVQLNDIANQSGVSWMSVSQAQPSAARAGAGPATIGIQMQIQGDYFSILRFVDTIRDADRLMTVETFSLSGEGAAMSASLAGRMFLSPETAPQPARPGTAPTSTGGQP